MQLDSMKVIVTGAAGGMGAWFARRLAEAGAQVAVGDVNTEGLDALVRDAEGLPGAIHARALDVADLDACEAFVPWAASAMGGLNGLINNAGIIRDGLLVKRDRRTGDVVKLDRSRWQEVLDVNLTGATWMVREVAGAMIEAGSSGVVVNISSIARHGNRGQSNYAAAKAALAANTVTWSREFAPYGIRVGSVAPGMIETPMTRGMNPKAREAIVQMIAVGRIGQPEDIWLAVKFILECDYFNGRTIDVDGGLKM